MKLVEKVEKEGEFLVIKVLKSHFDLINLKCKINLNILNIIKQ